ncbi:MAG TPA: HemK/PrmC family methyltransferase, partial [Acidimicrobiales bacterium]|nr:HemK/PrmC family methyltransferase [Acidimicrobiales bacterium]
MITWRELLFETADRVGDGTEARWLCQEASGMEGAEWALGLELPATEQAVARLDAMVERRGAGEPLQYVLGHWAFRGLDLLVDRRVLIPRPETEQLVEVALAIVPGLARSPGSPLVIVDLGTGSGVIGLSLAAELVPMDLAVWACDSSDEALQVAGANLAGIGRAAVNVRLACGTWYEALPATLAGGVHLVVSNPPYIADGDLSVEAVVREWEPEAALFAGEDGLQALREV